MKIKKPELVDFILKDVNSNILKKYIQDLEEENEDMEWGYSLLRKEIRSMKQAVNKNPKLLEDLEGLNYWWDRWIGYCDESLEEQEEDE